MSEPKVILTLSEYKKLQSDIAEQNGKIDSISFKRIYKTVSIPGGSANEPNGITVDISSDIPEGKHLIAVAFAMLNQYPLPYHGGSNSGDTWISSVHTNTNQISISNTTSAWNNYDLFVVAMLL